MGLYERIGVAAGVVIGTGICEPQLRLGRRRHNGICDRCGEPVGAMAAEHLEFPDSGGADTATAREEIWTMLHASYAQYCFDCFCEIDQDTDRGGGDA